MKTAWCVLLAGVLAIGAIGCANDRMCCPPTGRGLLQRGFACRPGICARCGLRGCGGCGGLGMQADAFTPGPAMGAVSYPYYTMRGPRDFLATNPTPIGP